MNQEETIIQTQDHKMLVHKYLTQYIRELKERSLVHDASKLIDPELGIFTKYSDLLKASVYGSDEYKYILSQMKVALDHHYTHNSHHPEHYVEGVDGMNLLDLVEMFFDWYAATFRHDTGDIHRSIELNKDRFRLSNQLVNILHNTADDFADVHRR
jgi:hypothetical protein